MKTQNRNQTFKFRLSNFERQLLNRLAINMARSKSDTIRILIRAASTEMTTQRKQHFQNSEEQC